MMNAKLMLGLMLCIAVLGACQTKSSGSPPAVKRGTGYLDKGPTVELAGERESGASTTLERLGELESENEDLRNRLAAVRKDLARSRSAVQGLDERLQARTEELERRERELEVQVASNRALQDDYLRARIAKARLEQEVLQLQLANLIQEDR